jgi:nucleotide-binding universal stress UspA family protein
MLSTEAANVVVVGVTSTGENPAALRFATHYAQRHGSTVRLVHALHQLMPPSTPSPLLPGSDLKSLADRFVADAAAEVAEIAKEMDAPVETTTIVARGRPSRVLAAFGSDARLIVVEHRSVGRLTRVFTGSTAARLAARAAGPVVSVPSHWRPASRPGWVTVGIHENGARREVLTAAFETAADLGARLRVMHAWRIDSMYAELIEQEVDQAWKGRAADNLRSQVESVQVDYPSVEYELEVRHSWAEEALMRAAETSDMLVVGRQGSAAVEPEYLGHLARMLIREAPCPVLVVPPRKPE